MKINCGWFYDGTNLATQGLIMLRLISSYIVKIDVTVPGEVAIHWHRYTRS